MAIKRTVDYREKGRGSISRRLWHAKSEWCIPIYGFMLKDVRLAMGCTRRGVAYSGEAHSGLVLLKTTHITTPTQAPDLQSFHIHRSSWYAMSSTKHAFSRVTVGGLEHDRGRVALRVHTLTHCKLHYPLLQSLGGGEAGPDLRVCDRST